MTARIALTAMACGCIALGCLGVLYGLRQPKSPQPLKFRELFKARSAQRTPREQGIAEGMLGIALGVAGIFLIPLMSPNSDASRADNPCETE